MAVGYNKSKHTFTKNARKDGTEMDFLKPKIPYSTAELEIISFRLSDIITTSGMFGEEESGNPDDTPSGGWL